MPYKDPEARRAHQRRYYAEHRAELLAYQARYQAERKARDPKAWREEANRRRRRRKETHPEEWINGHRLRTYKLTPEAFQAMWNRQGGVCGNPGCDTPLESGVGGAHIDHDHACCPGPRSCGKCVRGLLCHRCNKALGLLLDDPERIEGLAAYLAINHMRSET